MSDDDCPVPEKLCKARRETLEEKIESVKRTLYACSATIIAVIAIVQFLLTLYR